MTIDDMKLTDDELRARLQHAMGDRRLEPFVEPLRELQQRRAAPEVDNEHLSSAIAALGDIMLEMQRRKLLARPGASAKTREVLSAKSMTDEQVGALASKAFEAGAMELARRGYPGATVFSCSPSEEPVPWITEHVAYLTAERAAALAAGDIAVVEALDKAIAFTLAREAAQ